jgi:hypothetical protein
MNYVGKNGDKALFIEGNLGVIVDEKTKEITYSEYPQTLLSSGTWSIEDKPSKAIFDLAVGSLSDLDIKIFSANDRMYTIPKSVQTEAKRALEWKKEYKRGGTSVGMNTARTLAKGGQIGIKKVRHIAKYFPRHEVDKKAKGYKPGEEGYPSAGRIAWALWGGDAAQRWAAGIVEREDKKKKETSLLSYGYEAPKRVDYSAFNREIEPEFFVRLRTDGSGIDRLYKVEQDGSCTVWDDGYWDDLGNISHDFETYDKSLDDPYDKVKKIHVPIDKDSAIALAAMFDNRPESSVLLRALNFEETDLLEKAIPEEDWAFIDQLSDNDEFEDDLDFDDDGLVAASGFKTDQDGNYTPEERSEKAKQQVRDKTGKFAKSGSSVVIGGDPNKTGQITSINPDTQEVAVKLANGDTVNVPASLTESADTFEPVSTANFPQTNLDFTGILGEPRVPIDQPLAQLPGRLPPLTAPDVNLLVSDWSSWVSGQRLSPEYSGDPVKPFVPKELPDINTVMGKYFQGAFNPDGTAKSGWNPAIASNVYNEPMLRDWLDTKYKNKSGVEGYHNVGWYKPDPAKTPIEEKKSRSDIMSRDYRNMMDDKFNRVNFSVVAAAGQPLTPETSDVPPMYMAIVAEDDPQAVMELVSLIPAGKDSSQPQTFTRNEGKWEPDEGILSDLQSPTPPPVVVLDNEMLSEVLAQIEGDPAGDKSGLVSSLEFDASVLLSKNPVVLSLVAKGGLDRNRGNAERLRRYWKFGPGALKIRWNTPGDWTRCYRQLAKHMGPRAKGYCSLRHKEMTGTWPGSKYNIGKKKKRGRVASITAALESVRSEEKIISEFTLKARAAAAKSQVAGGRASVRPHEHGSKFIIPLVIPEEKESGDGRVFNKNAITFRDLPLPLLWQIKTGQGHDGSVVVGQILSMERTGKGIGNAYGVFDYGEFGKEAERLVKNGFIRGVSADMDQFEADEEEVLPEAGEKGDTKKIGGGRISITKARVMAVTIVPKPAFQECFIQIIEETPEPQEDEVVPDGTYVDGVNPLDAAALVACGMIAGAIPVEPPSEWFSDPSLTGPTPLTVTDEGRVFGHIAAWHVDHIGMAYGTKPPRSRSKYSYFHTGVVRTLDGTDVSVGQLTLAGGHAGLEASAQEAVRHYDDTASAIADVHAGEDNFGIWVAGSLRPDASPEQIRALRASAPSGDWRPIKGQLELVAVCQVNVPGFPIARARVASGQVMALVAAGASALAEMKHDPLAEVIKKVEQLEKQPLLAAAEQAKTRFAEMNASILAKKQQELAARVGKVKTEIDDSDYMNQMFDEDPEAEMSVISRRVRERLAKDGKALKDGSYPIRNVSDLKNAVRAYGRSKPGKRAEVRKHIMRRARGLNRSDLIPEKWRNASSDEAAMENPCWDGYMMVGMKTVKGKQVPNCVPEGAGDVSDLERVVASMRQKADFAAKTVTGEAVSALTAAKEPDPDLVDLTPEEIEALKQEKRQQGRLPERDEDGRIKYTPDTQPRDASGKFRKILARLKSDLGPTGLQKVIDKVEEAENLDSAGDYISAADSAADLLDILDRMDSGALNPERLENIQEGAKELGEVIANLPFAFGEDAQKVRFSDLPPSLGKLMEDLVDRVYARLDDEEDADEATSKIKTFMSGGDYFSQGEISAEMAKLLRLLT